MASAGAAAAGAALAGGGRIAAAAAAAGAPPAGPAPGARAQALISAEKLTRLVADWANSLRLVTSPATAFALAWVSTSRRLAMPAGVAAGAAGVGATWR
jgi:hypothetical protein